MMNRDVAVLPKKRRPPTRKCPNSAEPAIDEVRDEDWPMGMIVEVDTDVYARDPTKHQSRSCHKGDARPRARDAGYLRVLVEPERASICREANNMEGHAMPVLG